MIHVPSPRPRLRQPQRVQPLSWTLNRLLPLVLRLCSTCTRPQAFSHANTTMLKCDQPFSSSDQHCMQEKRVSSENPTGISVADGKTQNTCGVRCKMCLTSP